MEKTSKNSRRNALKTFGASLAGIFGFAGVNAAVSKNESASIITGSIEKDQDVPLFSGHKIHNGVVYIAGKGYHEEGDITVHTNAVLDSLEKIWPGISEKYIEGVRQYWPQALAILHPGYISKIQPTLRNPVGNLYFAGAYTEQPGLDGAVHSALRAVKQWKQGQGL